MALPVANTGGPYAAIAEGDLPQNVNLNGSTSDPGDGSSITVYSWKLAKPAGSAATLSDPAVATPVLQNVDVWGTYALFLVVTNNLGQTSKTAPREAPDSAFAWIVVEASTAQLVMPASGQRNWTDANNHAIAVLRALKDTFDGHGIADHDTLATGAQLDTLTQGGDATGLHTHTNSDLAAAIATTAALGVVKLQSDALVGPLDPANPRAATQKELAFSGHYEGDVAIIAVGGGGGGTPVDETQAQVAIYLPEMCYLVKLTGTLRRRGDLTNFVTLAVYVMTYTQYGDDDFAGATYVGDLRWVKTAERVALLNYSSFIPGPNPILCPAGSVIALKCTEAPVTTLATDVNLQVRVLVPI